MVKVLRLGQMEPVIKEIMLRDAKMVRAASPGPIRARIQETSLKTTLKDMVFTTGLMVVSTKANGKTIRWKVKASSNGLTAESTTENTSTIRKKAWEHSTGLMVANMRDNG